MMVVHCNRLDREVMIWTGSIHGISDTEHGLVMTYKCACGEAGQLLTGSKVERELSAHA